MAQFKTDLRDIYFNLFSVLKIQRQDGVVENDVKEIINECNKFIEKEVYPTRTIGDHEGVKLSGGVVTAPKSFADPMKKYYENGWHGIGYPEDIGGMPSPHSVSIVCQSIMNGANVAFAMYPGLSRGAMDVILKAGSQEQRDTYVPNMLSGVWGGTMCLTEPGAGSDVGAVISTATPAANGMYKIKGIKIFISSGDNQYYENIIHLVLAKTPGAPAGTKGLSLFIVPKIRLDGTPNDVHCTKIEEKMGIHGQATCELTFGGAGNCEGVLIGKEFEGMVNMFILMNEARLLCGVQGESQANLVYMLTEQYAKERSQFGKEIVNLPDVKRTLFKMRATSRALRSIILYTGDLFDRAHHGEAGAEDEIAFMTPICKSYCSDEGFQVAVDAIQTHGGYGFCSEYGIEQFARDLKIASIYEGTNAIQAMDFTMRKVLKDNAKTFMGIGAKIQKTMARKEAQEFPEELALLAKNLQKAQEILAQFGAQAKANKYDAILFHSMGFLNFSANLIAAWLLLEGACEAIVTLPAAQSAEDKDYYQSKKIDFRVFTQQQLVKNSGIAQSILNFKEDLSQLNV
ncbi:MAG: acyl-CoA dehydrogenase family protein [Bdellovibrionales bacterium]|nr:acyl-CoA dehydrogenase family protein [Bdellovibrionales bacterium]